MRSSKNDRCVIFRLGAWDKLYPSLLLKYYVMGFSARLNNLTEKESPRKIPEFTLLERSSLYDNIRCCCDVLMENIHSLYPVICKLIFKRPISLIFHVFKYHLLWDIYLICSGLLYMLLQSCLNASYLALLVSFFSRVLPYRTPKFLKLILCCCCCISSSKHFVFVLELGLAVFIRAFHYVS